MGGVILLGIVFIAIMLFLLTADEEVQTVAVTCIGVILTIFIPPVGLMILLSACFCHWFNMVFRSFTVLFMLFLAFGTGLMFGTIVLIGTVIGFLQIRCR